MFCFQTYSAICNLCALHRFSVVIFCKVIITVKPREADLLLKKNSVISLDEVSCCYKTLVEMDTMDVEYTN